MSTFQLDVITGAVDIDDAELCRIIRQRGGSITARKLATDLGIPSFVTRIILDRAAERGKLTVDKPGVVYVYTLAEVMA